jgi:hypothetical protein
MKQDYDERGDPAQGIEIGEIARGRSSGALCEHFGQSTPPGKGSASGH